MASQPVDTTIVTVETPDPFAQLARLSTPDAPGADGAGTTHPWAPAPWEVPSWAGFIAFEAPVAGRSLPANEPTTRPVVTFARYDAWFVQDHHAGHTLIVGDTLHACQRLSALLCRSTPGGTTPRGELGDLRAPSRGAHARAIEAALQHIAAGDIYQVNLTHAWQGRLRGDPLWLALAMRDQSPVPFGAYFDFGEHQLIARSMERFLRFDQHSRVLRNRPIKGTRVRTQSDLSDARVALARDPKERAEHAMIVDLMRNDLGRVAQVGTVLVEDVMQVEPYRGLYHLVSTVHCRVRDDVGLDNILHATFPPGSVTGAPKLRALQIIEALETHPRGAYTGALGFIDRTGGLSLAVTIRAAAIQQGRVTYHAGGGIVSASHSAREIDETVLKARVFLDAVGAEPHQHLAP